MLRLILAAQCELDRRQPPRTGAALVLPVAVGGLIVAFAAVRQVIG